MRILHTADWHLGQTLRGRVRSYEQAEFLRWLLGVLREYQVDALLVAGDVFETANPGAEAQEAWFSFVAGARQHQPDLDIVVIGGNHDSAQRLDAPNKILSHFGVRVVGGLPRLEGGTIDFDRVVVPITSSSGARAWVVAVPFLRVSDLPRGTAADAHPEGMRTVYGEVVNEALRRREHGEPVLAMGHLYMAGGAVSEASERKIVGNLDALPADLFPPDVAYVALGHLHKAQVVGARESIRYSGSPIPLSMAESGYKHEVCLVDVEERGRTKVSSIPIPRSVDLLRVPETGTAPISAVVDLLSSRLPARDATPPHLHPYVEVVVSTSGPEPSLMERVCAAMKDRAGFLVKVTRVHQGTSGGPAVAHADRKEYSPEQVFVERYRREHNAPPPDEYVRAFHELLEDVKQGGAA